MDFSKPRQADLISLSILLGIRKISCIVKKLKKMAMMVLAMITKVLKNKTMITTMLLLTPRADLCSANWLDSAPLLAQDVKLSYLMIRMMTRRRSTMVMIRTTTRSGVGMTKL